MQIWVYILKCADDRYYVGSYRGEDPAVREAEHNAGKYPDAWTYQRRPVEMLFAAELEDPNDAVALERKLKGWSRAKKEAVIRGDWSALPELSRRYSRPDEEEPERRWHRARPSTDGPIGSAQDKRAPWG